MHALCEVDDSSSIADSQATSYNKDLPAHVRTPLSNHVIGLCQRARQVRLEERVSSSLALYIPRGGAR